MSFDISQVVSQSELQRFFSGIGAHSAKEELKAGREGAARNVTTKELSRFFRVAEQHLELSVQKDRQFASRFNVFDLIEPDENKLSDVLKILLDPKGAHGQGDLFLRLLIKQLGTGLSTLHTKHATVQREAPTHGIEKYRRRIDVFVDAGDLVAVENKVDSPEQPDQVNDYLAHLRYCVRGTERKTILIYLTPDRRRPDSLGAAAFESAQAEGRLRCWGYRRELREWLEECRETCAARRIQDFLSEFIHCIETTIKLHSEPSDSDPANEH